LFSLNQNLVISTDFTQNRGDSAPEMHYTCDIFGLTGHPQALKQHASKSSCLECVETLKRLPENLYGLCSGNFDQPSQSRDQSLVPEGPLTPWLARYLDRLAGKPKDQPLTFGDLWGAPDRDVSERDTNLEVMTTCITLGHPYRIPFETDIFYFNLAEFERLFPDYVVTWMKEHPRASEKPNPYDGLGLHRLPAMADLPIVVAARMSLSFPILISAVPLYAIDYSRKVNNDDDRRPERCWFSDGGICSNFPVHFFDVPLPRWPTFAINLRPPHPDYPDELIRMAQRNSDGIIEGWTRFDDAKKGSDKLVGFLGDSVETAPPGPMTIMAKSPSNVANNIVHLIFQFPFIQEAAITMTNWKIESGTNGLRTDAVETASPKTTKSRESSPHTRPSGDHRPPPFQSTSFFTISPAPIATMPRAR
jgi:hypothetical protein